MSDIKTTWTAQIFETLLAAKAENLLLLVPVLGLEKVGWAAGAAEGVADICTEVC